MADRLEADESGWLKINRLGAVEASASGLDGFRECFEETCRRWGCLTYPACLSRWACSSPNCEVFCGWLPREEPFQLREQIATVQCRFEKPKSFLRAMKVECRPLFEQDASYVFEVLRSTGKNLGGDEIRSVDHRDRDSSQI